MSTIAAAYQRRRRLARAAGIELMRPPWKSQAHIRILLKAGFRMRDIEAASGVAHPTLSNIRAGRGKIYASTEARILATTQADVLRHCKEVPSGVSMRMLRALTVMGWTPADIAEVSTLSVQTVRDTRDDPRPRVYRSTADLIEHAYNVLAGLPEPQGAGARRMRALARSRGWTAPKAVAA